MSKKIKYKRCIACDERNPKNSFPKDGRTVDGYSIRCRRCHRSKSPAKYDTRTPRFEGIRNCRRCKKLKTSGNFSWRNKKKGLIETICKQCVKENTARLRAL